LKEPNIVTMSRGYAFKLMSPKDIAATCQLLQINPPVTPELIDRPNPENCISMCQQVGEFAYTLETHQIKARAPEVPMVGQYMEIFDEAIDTIATFKMTRQLSYINRIEDFNLKDMWDPQSKRMRAVLSGIINFCRYKESQTGFIESMKQDVQALNNVRLDVVDKVNTVQHHLVEAQAQHSAELEDVWAAENEMQEAQGVVEKLHKQKAAADRIQEASETKLEVTKERLADCELRTNQLRETMASLQEQIAESPEGLEQEIQELQMAIRLKKAKVQERSDEKRTRTQRVQILRRLKTSSEKYAELLDKVEEALKVKEAASARLHGARQEQRELSKSLDARETEEHDSKQSCNQIVAEFEAAKEAHGAQLKEFDDRRQEALVQYQALQAKRTDEQKRWDALQAEKLQLESEIVNVKRAYDSEIDDLQSKLESIKEEGKAYIQKMRSFTDQYDAEQGRHLASRPVMASPGRGHRASGYPVGSPLGLRTSPA